MDWMKMPELKSSGGGMQDMGMKMLQAALSQNRQNAATATPQPQPGQTTPGGAMNILPALQNGGGMGLLGKLFAPGGMFGSAVQPSGAVPMDSSNAIY
jgi:hypothetical protein